MAVEKVRLAVDAVAILPGAKTLAEGEIHVHVLWQRRKTQKPVLFRIRSDIRRQ